ncbi:MFS-type transporter [Apiospora kogelbergensis]
MPLGILEDRHLEHVPGTSPLSTLGRVDLEVSAGVDSNLLKHDPSGKTVLVPQPSESPNDPYNWPRWKKELFTVAIACRACTAVGPLLTSAFVPLAQEFDVPLERFTLGCNGAMIAAISGGSLICNTLAVKFGKRPIYLLTSIGLFATNFWAAEAKSFGSLVAARTLGGFSGAVIQYASWRTCLHAMGAAFVVQFLVTFFWMPESAFDRVGAIDIDTGEQSVVVEKVKKIEAEHVEDSTSTASPATEAKKSYLRELLPYSGYWAKVSFWRTFLQPFAMMASPVVLWATILFTTCISWLVLISVTLSQIFSAPPYNFSVAAVGASNLSSFVATLIATGLAGPIIDGCIQFMSKRNKGVFEPEFRLPIMMSYLLFTVTGFFAWGESLYREDPWPIPIIVGMGFINFGVQLGTTGVVAYVSDSHRTMAAEAFAAMNFIKNMFAFGMTFYINDWIATQGVRQCFFVIGGITIGVVLLTVPMYIFGKRARSFTYRHKLIRRLVE